MTTARDIIKASLRKIHVLGTGASLDDTEANDALSTLNNMLSSFSAEGALTFQEIKETFTLNSSQEQYTIGTVGGEDFNTIPPLWITTAYVTQGSTDYPVHPYDEREYSRISQKDVAGSVPRIFYYNNNFPTADIFFYPVPSGSDSFTMYSRKYLTSFTNLTSPFDMPAQYESMLIHNLAVWIAPEYEREASPTIRGIANKTKKTVIVENSRNEKHAATLSGIPTRGSSQQYTDHNVFGGYYT